ncbi:MAG TPA: DUF504 domain-containing protein [Burkholderiaceae bacterium]|jgi:uncharacterized protein (UPF0248 family)|nr:DUF504 domain-containing protein [Burkholderiaceae bacterium]
MMPIQELFHRIQWDPEFGKAEFMIGYHDRLAKRIVRVPFQRVHLAQRRVDLAAFGLNAEDEAGACPWQ